MQVTSRWKNSINNISVKNWAALASLYYSSDSSFQSDIRHVTHTTWFTGETYFSWQNYEILCLLIILYSYRDYYIHFMYSRNKIKKNYLEVDRDSSFNKKIIEWGLFLNWYSRDFSSIACIFGKIVLKKLLLW